MRLAHHSDKSIVLKILVESFINDPHFNYLFNTSKRPDRLNILFDFAFDETLRKGEIYIDDTNSAVALWLFEKKKKYL